MTSNAKQARPWPNNAAWIRDETAETANTAARRLGKLMERWNEVDELSKFQVVSLSQKDLLNICRLLESVGAQTRP